MPVVDEVSPVTYGEDRIVLTLSEQTPEPQAFNAVVVDVDYSAGLPEGVTLPLELTIVGPSGSETYQRRVFRRLLPDTLAFIPREGGEHLIRLAEQFHNRWFGALVLEIAGDPVREAVQVF